ncbi:Uncharacterised protein [Mycobacterium tuberculosis]|uniref:Uncharacterized protein n=1 Tax=Mycobacterium tuberculosis TaxID=1773 RepID=A0A0U0S917_MYCTX|nr:Uncharacterised protein [Mycobacterium tuberculosis]COW62692.1 Uncharacterised protein [Mycobacterium tuberculosis]
MARNTDVRLTSNTRSHSSSVMSATGVCPPSPALLTSTSSRPIRAVVESISASTWAVDVTSHTTCSTRPSPSADNSAAVSPSRRSWWSEITTSAPSAKARRAVAEPMPVPAAAVTTTTLPSRSPCPAISFGATDRFIPWPPGADRAPARR